MPHKLKVDALHAASGKAIEGYTMFRRTSALLILTLTACTGRTMVLDDAKEGVADAKVADPSPSERLPEGDSGTKVLDLPDEFVSFIAVDERRIYWTGTNPSSSGGYIRSCDKTNCEATKTELYARAGTMLYGFQLLSHELFWHEDLNLWSCSVDQCDNRREILPNRSRVLAIDQSDVYYVDDSKSLGIQTLPRDGARSVPRILPSIPDHTPSVGLGVRGNTISWISSSGAVYAQPRDGSGAARVLLKGNASEMGDSIADASSFAMDDRSLFRSVALLTGWLDRCELDSCPDGPKVVADGQLRPRTLLVTDRTLVFQRQLAGYSTRAIEIVACPKTNCADPTHLGTVSVDWSFGPTNVPSSALMTVDESNVYVVANANVLHGNDEVLASQIVRFDISH